jgi:vesicle coat complex subunit
VTNPKAKASIIWVVGEYVEVVKDYAPDILRLLAKEFTECIVYYYDIFSIFIS